MMSDIKYRDINEVAASFGMDITETSSEIELPETIEEAELYMQLTYKQAVEIAEEQALSVLFEGSNYELIKKRFYYDLTVLGIGSC